MFALISVVIMVALGYLASTIGTADSTGGSWLVTVYWLAVLIPSIAVAVRRMHDAGHSGWWVLVPIVNLIFALQNSQPGENEYGPNPKEATA